MASICVVCFKIVSPFYNREHFIQWWNPLEVNTEQHEFVVDILLALKRIDDQEQRGIDVGYARVNMHVSVPKLVNKSADLPQVNTSRSVSACPAQPANALAFNSRRNDVDKVRHPFKTIQIKFSSDVWVIHSGTELHPVDLNEVNRHQHNQLWPGFRPQASHDKNLSTRPWRIRPTVR